MSSRHVLIASASSHPPLGSRVIRASGKRLGQRDDGLGLVGCGQHPALELEVAEPVAVAGGLGETDDCVRGERLFVPDLHPLVGVGSLVGRGLVGEVGLGAVADEEQISQRLHAVALLPVAEKCGDRNLEMLAQQVQQRRLDSGHRVHGDAQVERLGAAAAGVAVGKRTPHVVEDGVVIADAAAGHDRAGVLEGAADRLPTGHLADTRVAVGVGQDHQVSGEERAVCAAEVQQHAVVARRSGSP